MLILGAVALSILGPWIAARMWLDLRSRAYKARLHEEVSTHIDRRDQAILKLKLAPGAERLRKLGSEMRDVLHKAANAAQDKYQEALAYGVSAIALAFVALSAAVVWGGHDSRLVMFSAVLDVACFLLSILAFWRAAHWNRIWMMRRAKNELVRQWSVLDSLLGPRMSDENALKDSYRAFSSRIEAAIGNEPTSFWKTVAALLRFWDRRPDKTRIDLSKRVLEIWSERREELAADLGGQAVTFAQYSTYLNKRPESQGSWFLQARRRLSHHGHWRATTLLQIFLAALVVAIAKLVLVLGWANDLSFLKPLLTFTILLLIGVSAAISALYLNQNNRSLVHRYGAQERHIKLWWLQHRPIVDRAEAAYAEIAEKEAVGTDVLPGNTSDAKIVAAEVRAEAGAEYAAVLPADVWAVALPHILAFEDLMIEELLDFISISEHDTLEISAA